METSLLNGREFRSLEHLNEVTVQWLAEVADVRVHRETKRRPLDLHAEELPYLIPIPEKPYDTAEVVYRAVNAEGMVAYRQNFYSVPWRYPSINIPSQPLFLGRPIDPPLPLLPLSLCRSPTRSLGHRPRSVGLCGRGGTLQSPRSSHSLAPLTRPPPSLQVAPSPAHFWPPQWSHPRPPPRVRSEDVVDQGRRRSSTSRVRRCRMHRRLWAQVTKSHPLGQDPGFQRP